MWMAMLTGWLSAVSGYSHVECTVFGIESKLRRCLLSVSEYCRRYIACEEYHAV